MQLLEAVLQFYVAILYMYRKNLVIHFWHLMAYSVFLKVDSRRTVRIGVVTNQTLPSDTDVFKELTAWTENWNKNYSASSGTTFELVPVNAPQNMSVKSVIEILCNSLFPQNVLGITSLVKEEKSHLLPKLAGIFDIPILGTSRSTSLINEAYGNYFRLLPSLEKDGLVLSELLISLGTTKFAILHDNTSDSRLISSHLNKPFKNHVTVTMETAFNTFKVFDELRLDVITHLARVRLRDIRVIVLCSKELLANLVFGVAADLQIHSADYLWIVSESIVQLIKDNRRNGHHAYPANVIAASLDISQTTTGKRGLEVFAHAIVSLNKEENTTNLPLTRASCYSNTTGAFYFRKRFERHIATITRSRKQVSSDLVPYSILELNHHLNSNVVWIKIGCRVNESMNINTSYIEKYIKIISPKIKKLRISTIAHGNYQYKLPGIRGPHCAFGVPCVELKNRNGTYAKEIFCVAGLMIDILNLLSNKLGFAYDLHFVKDGRYGGMDDKTGQWNGFIAELLNGEADMALATLTINAQRSRVVDFSYPFAEVGIGILTAANYKKTRFFNDFFNPLSQQLWLLTLATVVLVLMLLWILDKKSYEWFFKARPFWYSKEEKQRVTLLESMSYSWGTFVQTNAGEGLPRSLSARLVASFFAFAMLIIHTSYTANLAAHKVKEDLETPVTGIYDEKMLNPPPEFRFATMKDTSAESFFRDSQDPRLKQIYNNMKPYLVDVVEDGVEKVKNGYFAAYIEDKPYLEYLISMQMNCSLRLVGKPFGVSGYGIALPKNSPLTTPISQAILALHENNVLSQLWSKWVVRKCVNREEFHILPESMTLENASGLFIVLASAVVVSGILVAIENVALHFRKRYHDGTNLRDVNVLGDEAIEEIRLQKCKSTKRKGQKNEGFDENLDFKSCLMFNRTPAYFSDSLSSNHSAVLNGELSRKKFQKPFSFSRDYQNSKI